MVLAACGSRGGEAPPPETKRDAGVAAAPGVAVRAAPPFEIAAPTDKLVAVGRGATHACVVRASGAVDCWGTLATCATCELGAPPDPAVRRVPGVTDAVNISADGRCLIRRTGEAACFTGTGLELAAVAGVTTAIASDPHGKCFLERTGGVVCSRDDKVWRIRGLADAIALAGSELSTCAVKKTGRVVCGSAWDDAPWAPVRNIAGVTKLAMTGRMEQYVCAVMDAKVRCFSLNTYAEPGQSLVAEFTHDNQSYDLPHAERFAGATELVMWSVDNRFRLDALVGGKVVSTELGEPWEVPLLSDAAVLGRECAIRAQGSLVCWGANDGGVLAQPTTIMRADVAPTTVVGLTDVTDIAVGLSRSYALTSDGRVWWWGRIWNNGSLVRSATPTPLKLGLGPGNIVQITANRANNVCMRSEKGEVWCQVEYLESRIEQLDADGVRDMSAFGGDVVLYRTGAPPEVHAIGGTERFRDATMAITQLFAPDAVEHAFIGDSSCARRSDGTVRCPGEMEGITAATQLGASYDLGCVLQRGRVWCWLDVEYLRRGPLTQVAGVRDATDIAVSPEGACAVHEGGRVSCWTYDEQAAEGDKRRRTWRPPVEVIRGGAVDVEVGQGRRGQYKESFQLHGPDSAGAYGCARMADRTMQCWGMNVFGELGDGSVTDSEMPIGVKL